MRIIYLSLILISCFCRAEGSVPLASCLSYEVNRIDKDTGMFVLENVFAPQLFESLNKSFAEHNLDWTAWTTSVEEYIDEDGQEKTELKGCFDITKIHDNSTLIASIMRVAMARFQAAMNYYSKSDSALVPESKVDVMLNDYEQLLKSQSLKIKKKE